MLLSEKWTGPVVRKIRKATAADVARIVAPGVSKEEVEIVATVCVTSQATLGLAESTLVTPFFGCAGERLESHHGRGAELFVTRNLGSDGCGAQLG